MLCSLFQPMHVLRALSMYLYALLPCVECFVKPDDYRSVCVLLLQHRAPVKPLFSEMTTCSMSVFRDHRMAVNIKQLETNYCD